MRKKRQKLRLSPELLVDEKGVVPAPLQRFDNSTQPTLDRPLSAHAQEHLEEFFRQLFATRRLPPSDLSTVESAREAQVMIERALAEISRHQKKVEALRTLIMQDVEPPEPSEPQ